MASLIESEITLHHECSLERHIDVFMRPRSVLWPCSAQCMHRV